MAGRFSIARKIFGLAVILLCLTVGLACFLLWQVTRLQGELRIISIRDTPLTNTLAKINEHGLRRRLAFERWFGALNSDRPNKEIVAEASTNYDLFTEHLNTEFAAAKKLLEMKLQDDAYQEEFGEIKALLGQIESTYPQSSARQREVLDLQRAGQHERAHDIIAVLNDVQRTLQVQREQMRDKMAAITLRSVQTAVAREKHVIWLTIAATVSSVLLGLTLAAFITQRLVGPVRALVIGLSNVEKGDLSVELPVLSRDEVGILTQSFNYFVRELRSKEELRRTFGKYVDPRILEQVILQPGVAGTAGSRRVMTVLFADLAGFTGISEQLTPSGMVNLLNRHFTLQAEAVQKHKGVIDKFMGDALMAFWGPPFAAEGEHALLACRAALEQLQALEALRAELAELTGLRKNLPHVDLRIGISTGEVIVGNIGAENARSYTVIGDAVNLGQRLEQANRVYGTRILLSEDACKAAGADIVAREIDLLVVKGKTETTRVFELLGLKSEVPETILRFCEGFSASLAAYRHREWGQAETLLRGCLDMAPDDGPSKLFLDRIRKLRDNPPDESWQGIWTLESK